MASEKKIITLKSSDGEIFELEETVALESQTIKNMIEDNCADNVIPLPNVTGKTLAKVIEYCKKHVEEGKESEDKLKEFDGELVKVDMATLLDLIHAANYLNIRALLNLVCQTVAEMIKEWKVEKVREEFNIDNDFTEEEEAALRKENEWAFN